MLTIGASVVEAGGERRALMVIVPETLVGYEQMAARLRPAGVTRVSPHDWNRLALSLGRCTITAQGGHITEAHTGASRLVLPQPYPVSALWLEAAQARRPVLALVPPGTLPQGPSDRERQASDAELSAYPAMIDHAAADGRLLAAFARLLDAPAPVAGPGTRTMRPEGR